MNRLLTRRRFGQVAIAGTTLAGLAYLGADKTLAKSPTKNLFGVLADVETGTIKIQSVNIPDLKSLNLLDLSSKNVLNLQVLDETKNFIKTILQLDNDLEEFTGLSSFNGELNLSSSSIGKETGTDKKGRKKQKQNKLKTIGKSNSNTLTITGLGQDEKIRSVEALDKDSLVAIVAKSSVFGSSRIVKISRSKGNLISTGFPLPQTHNFSTLTQCPDGTIYASSNDPTGYTNLVQIDLAAQKVTKLVQLNFQNEVWKNGLAGLACSPTGELIALAAPRYVAINNLYKVDIKTGALTLLFEGFNANKIAFLSVK
ncbi:hypothetical protein WKK05_02850 [Nostoc sp. UHCC 0302]|uniref:hypothetical protein n=1 Tax=Nostoc sp. UHCC 0302 TaxID=3134896 RepID=UPI00311CC0A3